MPLAAPTTAEQVMAAIEAVVANGATAEADMVAAFLDSTPVRATAALDMAVELGLLTKHANTYKATNPLCRYTLNADQKAAVLRVALEAYQPFNKFRERLVSTADVSVAAKQTKTLCGLTADRDEVRDTLLSLGTYGHALVTEGAGNYQLEVGSLANHLQVLAAACTELMAAEGRIRAQLGPAAEQVLRDQRDNVIVPLANALVKANNRDGPGAVQQAGNAVEAHIDALAVRKVVVLTGAKGIISKLQKFENPTRQLPAKLVQVGTYLGSIRNAADHGTDPHIGNTRWKIRDATGLEYVYVACSFIAATIAFERGDPAEI
ncbi:MAG: hypothetical protein LAN63_14900 [Acidobacteriia bacterium]|nr:hypothetical protein [Terriglobia bacterium]